MPAKHSVKNYKTNSIYHVFNRGMDKRLIFLDNEDYWKFLDIIKKRLLSKPKNKESPESLSEEIYGNIKLIAYCFMPNHFHLLIEQKSIRAMERFMRSISIAYSMYFNKKYGKSGKLMQGIYKAVNIVTPEQLRVVGGYIHRNPSEIIRNIKKYPWSSYGAYCNQKELSFLTKERLIDVFEGSINDLMMFTDRVEP